MGVQFAGNILVQSDGGPLPISMGGTGQTTAPTAINALVPVQLGNTGKVLTTNGSVVSWQTTAAGVTPGGADTQVQFNDAGNLGGNSNFTINKTTGAITAAVPVTSVGYIVSDAAATTRSVNFQTAGSDRWLLETTSTAETGSNAGSNFALVSVGDNGATRNVAFSVARNTGVVDFKTTPTINGIAIDTNPGTVTSVSVTTANGISGSVATNASTPAITLTLGDITPTSVAAIGTITGSNVSGSTSGTNTGNETVTTLGAITAGATGKSTPIDTDTVGISDSASSNILKKLTWANLKSAIKTYTDTLYQATSANLASWSAIATSEKQATLESGTNIKTINSSSLLGSGNLSVGDVTLTGTQTLTNKTLTGVHETQITMGASNIDLLAGNYFTRTISGVTTLTVSNVPVTGTSMSFILDLTNAGSATITWWPGVKWPGGTVPTLTVLGRDVLGFFTYNGGITWTGFVLGKDVK